MRWQGQDAHAETADALPGLARVSHLLRTVTTPEFAGMTFHEVTANSALNRVSAPGFLPFKWTLNPYRGCSHACVYCFARASHRYLDLDTGRGFDTQIVVKVNVVEVLRKELSRASWKGELVALGTNTDPYQRAEGRYALMPGIIREFARTGTPYSVLTKGTLLRRDLPLMASEAAPLSRLAMSIAVFDPELQATIEPGIPSADARLATVAAAAEAGLDVGVFLMPVLPHLTDSPEQLDAAFSRIKAAGATYVEHGLLHLRPGVKEWFAGWLRTHRPRLVPVYRRLYGTGSTVDEEYATRIHALLRELRDAHGLRRETPAAAPEVARPAGAATLF